MHITFSPCGCSARQGSCLGGMEFSKQKCMTSDHTLTSGWGFGWLCFGISTPATNKDLLFDYISQHREPQGRVNFFVVSPMSTKCQECGEQSWILLYFWCNWRHNWRYQSLARNWNEAGGSHLKKSGVKCIFSLSRQHVWRQGTETSDRMAQWSKDGLGLSLNPAPHHLPAPRLAFSCLFSSI